MQLAGMTRHTKLIAAEKGYDDLMASLKKPEPVTDGRKAAIIGGGPTGIAAAYFLGRAGIPVTVFEQSHKLGGVPRLVTEGTTGLLCAAGDADALAENCCRLLEDDDLCTRLGHAGRERAQRDFSFARMVADHQTLMSAADERL